MNICAGDYVEWDAPQFEGGSFYHGRSTGKPRFVGTQSFAGVVERDSYGEKTGQHTFSIRLADGSLKRVKGRNLYPNITRHAQGVNHASEAEGKAARKMSRHTDNRDTRL